GAAPPTIPHARVTTPVASVAAAVRRRLGIAIDDQLSWDSASEAFQEWRDAVEKQGIFVFLLAMGRDACRGFSLYDDRAPIIAINTWWNAAARSFSLFHEYAHLVTRTSSICAQDGRLDIANTADPAERWCEEFGASILLPADDVMRILRDLDISTPVQN